MTMYNLHGTEVYESIDRAVLGENGAIVII